MNKNIIILIITAAMAFTACNSTPKTEKEKQIERYEAAFRDYVTTDFDDPRTLVDVTSVEVEDTTTTTQFMELVGTMNEAIVMLGLDTHKKELDGIAARLKKEKGLVFFNVKARVNVDERPKVMTYFGYENLTDGTIKMSDNKIDVHDPLLPDVYGDLVKFTDDFCETFGVR